MGMLHAASNVDILCGRSKWCTFLFLKENIKNLTMSSEQSLKTFNINATVNFKKSYFSTLHK